ncbi:MAG: PEP-utilizing enzyme [Bacteroidota bacterium]|nr:PEP-utilizing enzyme [Bacteroidota bacterium]
MKFVSSRTPASQRHGTFGGKADNLFRLTDEHFIVPEFVVLPQEEGLSVFPEAALLQNDFDVIRKCIHEYVIPETFIAGVTASLISPHYSVRSSAADEDGGQHSFAGQFETKLFVTKETMAASIKEVWLSAYSERVSQYRKTNGIQSKHGIAVIIQRMIDPDVSGVAFGIHPATGDRKTKVISAVFGLGEGIVSGELNADNFFIRGEKITVELAEKTEKIIADQNAGHGIVKVALPEMFRNRQTLVESQVHEISEILDKLKAIYGRPQDIEFACVGNTVYLLQTRPVTTVGRSADPDGEYIVWDNSNIIESYPGLSSPLTFSFIRKMYEAVYIQFSAIMGIDKKEIAEQSAVYANMLGLLDGRVYYNLRSWYKLLSLLPGYSLNAGFMEKMMGVKEKFELSDYVPRTKFRERMRVLNMVRLTLSNLRKLPKMRKSFTLEFNNVMNHYDAMDFSTCTSWELMRFYKDFEQTLLKKWKAPLVNDFFAMIYYGTLQKLVVKYGLDEAGTLHNDLLCGARDIISTEPIHRCRKIAAEIMSDKNAEQLFNNTDDAFIWKELSGGKFPGVKKQMDQYISDWGDRTVGELKLETITYRQDPKLLVRVLKGFLLQRESAQKDFDLKMRDAAEEVVRKKLSGKPFKKVMFGYFLRKSRDLVSSRENLRYARTRGFGMVRRMFIAIGQNLYSENVLDDPRDIFWLKLEEIFDFIQGTSETRSFRPLIALRKNEYADFSKKETAERIPTKGIVYVGNDFSVPPMMTNTDNASLKGIACCPGIVKARIRVVHDPHSLSSLDGDILVTASTDPGWVTLFPSASAILVERGSLLSHSAIVSREMGIPCIVGITGLLKKVKTGDLVEMNGSTGEIHILNT